MTPRERLEALKQADVQARHTSGSAAALQRCGCQHALGRPLVVATIEGREMVRGLFSASRIARQLGMEIVPAPIAQTFAEIEQELSR